MHHLAVLGVAPLEGEPDRPDLSDDVEAEIEALVASETNHMAAAPDKLGRAKLIALLNTAFPAISKAMVDESLS